jgi:hypothetical protein
MSCTVVDPATEEPLIGASGCIVTEVDSSSGPSSSTLADPRYC